MVKNLPVNAGDMGSILGLGRAPGEGNGNLLQYSCLRNLMDRGAWQATVHGVAKSWTQLSDCECIHRFTRKEKLTMVVRFDTWPNFSGRKFRKKYGKMRKEKRVSEDEVAGWHHQCNEHELGQTPGDGEEQGGLRAAAHGVTRVRRDWATGQQQQQQWENDYGYMEI